MAHPPLRRRLDLSCVLCLALLGCVSASVRPYDPAALKRPSDPLTVQVFWSEPPFAYDPLGEVIVDAGTTRIQSVIEKKMKEAVAQLGGNVAIVRDTQNVFTGLAHSRTFIVIAAIKKASGNNP